MLSFFFFKGVGTVVAYDLRKGNKADLVALYIFSVLEQGKERERKRETREREQWRWG